MNRTAIRVADILEQIANSPDGATLSEISRAQNIPKSTTFDILHALQDSGMIYVRDVERTRYAIGFRAFAIGRKYQISSHLLSSAKEEVFNLSQKLSKTVFLGKKYNNKVFYIYKEEANNEIIKTPEVGDLIPIYCTAIGKVLLSYSKSYKQQVEELELTKLTKNTIIDKNILLDQLLDIKNKKYAVEIGERDALLYSIAAPLFNFENKMSGAVSFSYIYNSEIDIESEIQQVRNCAINISKNMGYKE